MITFDPALAVAFAHERRRRNPLPALIDTADDALAIVRAEELRRAMDRLGATLDRAMSP